MSINYDVMAVWKCSFSIWIMSVCLSSVWSVTKRLQYVITGNRTALQNSKLQNFPSDFQSESPPEHHKRSSTQSWVMFELHHSLVLLLFVSEMLTRLLRKCAFLIGFYQVFRLFIKNPFQTMSDLSWHTCKTPLHCTCLASKSQHKGDHLLLLCTVVPFPDA